MYKAVEYDEEVYYFNQSIHSHRSDIHGPAVMAVQHGWPSVDTVNCVRCLLWPSQAADWPIRHRNYGWPDSATIDHVVNHGCDVVGVAHRQYRQHEVIGKRQLRLSFSRAEIVLINSWMPVQQIVYHLLRVFMKTELLTDSADNYGSGTLSNYHIKTLMLSACEVKTRSCWTDNLNLVRMCVELMQDLAVWLIEAQCPHYFINKCNLLDSSFNLETIRSRLISISRSCMSSWLIDNYIRRCSQLCPHSVSRLFEDVGTTLNLLNAVSTVVDWRQNTTLLDSWKAFAQAYGDIAEIVSHKSLSVWSLDCWLTELRKISTSLLVHFTAVACLHIARKTSRTGLNDELMNVLASTCWTVCWSTTLFQSAQQCVVTK